MTYYILRYGEIFLKGKNRYEFVRRLAKNINYCLKQEKINGELERTDSRFILKANKEPNLKRVFGLISYSLCVKTTADYDSIEKEVLKLAKKIDKNKSFRISTQKSTKKLKSREINQKLGEAIVNAYDLPVSLKNFDVEIGIDILGKDAYVFTETKKCFGGLPSGCEGRVLALLEDEKSILAAILMMKRGCAVLPVAFKKTDISLLEKYSCGSNIRLIVVKDVKEINNLLKEFPCEALVTGKSLENTEEINVDVPVLKPLVGMSEEKIKKQLDIFTQA